MRRDASEMAQWANVLNSPIRGSVSIDQFKLALPFRGTEGRGWVANFFVAHWEEDQFRDYCGCSRTYPEHKGTDSQSSYPSKEGYWITPPKHDPEFSIMDLSVQKGRANLFETKAPPMENIESFHTGEWITVGVFLAGLGTEEIAIAMRVGSRQCIKVVSYETEIENHMVFGAPFCFLEDGPGSIVVFENREPIADSELVVQCLSEL